MVNYIDLKLKSVAGHTEIVINGQRIKCAADYDRETGVLYWRIRNHNPIRRNYVAGSSKGTRDGYRQVSIKGKHYQEHRIIMMLCFGHIPENAEIDRINHVRNDNRLCNLRFVTRSENRRNQSVNSKNTSGVTGGVFLESQEKVYGPNQCRPGKHIPRNVRYVGRSRRRTGGSQFKI